MFFFNLFEDNFLCVFVVLFIIVLMLILVVVIGNNFIVVKIEYFLFILLGMMNVLYFLFVVNCFKVFFFLFVVVNICFCVFFLLYFFLINCLNNLNVIVGFVVVLDLEIMFIEKFLFVK